MVVLWMVAVLALLVLAVCLMVALAATRSTGFLVRSARSYQGVRQPGPPLGARIPRRIGRQTSLIAVMGRTCPSTPAVISHLRKMADANTMPVTHIVMLDRVSRIEPAISDDQMRPTNYIDDEELDALNRDLGDSVVISTGRAADELARLLDVAESPYAIRSANGLVTAKDFIRPSRHANTPKHPVEAAE